MLAPPVWNEGDDGDGGDAADDGMLLPGGCMPGYVGELDSPCLGSNGAPPMDGKDFPQLAQKALPGSFEAPQ